MHFFKKEKLKKKLYKKVYVMQLTINPVFNSSFLFLQHQKIQKNKNARPRHDAHAAIFICHFLNTPVILLQGETINKNFCITIYY